MLGGNRPVLSLYPLLNDIRQARSQHAKSNGVSAPALLVVKSDRGQYRGRVSNPPLHPFDLSGDDNIPGGRHYLTGLKSTVIPAQAGICVPPPLDSCFRRNDENVVRNNERVARGDESMFGNERFDGGGLGL